MIQREMCNFLKQINNFYPNFEVTKEKIIAWQSVLYFVKIDDFQDALIRYVKNEPYPPVISTLLDYWVNNDFERSKDKAGQ